MLHRWIQRWSRQQGSWRSDTPSKNRCGKRSPERLPSKKGWEIVKSRWIDINKGDGKSPTYRSRMVGKEFNDSVQEGLFAATPPLEALRLLLSHAASYSPPYGISAAGSRLTMKHCRSLLIADVSMALFEAPPRETSVSSFRKRLW